MKKPYDMYKKIANEEQVERHQVKTLGMGFAYAAGFKGNVVELEDRIRKTVQMAKRFGVI